MARKQRPGSTHAAATPPTTPLPPDAADNDYDEGHDVNDARYAADAPSSAAIRSAAAARHPRRRLLPSLTSVASVAAAVAALLLALAAGILVARLAPAALALTDLPAAAFASLSALAASYWPAAAQSAPSSAPPASPSTATDRSAQAAEADRRVYPNIAGPAAPPAPAYFTHEHFRTHLGVDYLQRSVIDPAIADLLRAHDPYTDEEFLENKESALRWAQHLAFFLDAGGFPEDSRLFVKYISEEKGYGVFAAVDISDDQPLMDYTGVITNNSVSDHLWDYPSEIRDEKGKIMQLGIDARFRGNMARYVNDARDPNCDSVFVPHRGLWHVVYVTLRPIRRGEEITVSYGENYWDTRPDLKMMPPETIAL